MKKLIIFFVIMTASLFSQGWNNVVQTNIPFIETSSSSIDLVTNKYGNHILVCYNTSLPTNYYLKYYLLNTSGSIIRSYTFETQYVEFASIDGTDDRIYVVYKLGNQIKTKKSTNAGQSWSDIDPINIGNNNCSNIDITFGKDDNALHVVWATQDNGNYYETYYKRLDAYNSWGAEKTVTDYGDEVGGYPTVSKSTDRVHVSYNGNGRLRDKYNDTWQTPQTVFSDQSWGERIHAGNSKLFDFYYKVESGPRTDMYVKTNNFGSTSWSTPVLLTYYANVYDLVSAANTYDGKTHIVYEIGGGVGYRNFNGSSWSSEEEIGNQFVSPKISSVSNDLFVVWGDDSEDYIYYRQYDVNPLAPQNLSVTESGGHPLPTWNANIEADINGYIIDRYEGTTSDPISIYWENNIDQVSTTSFIDYHVNIGPVHEDIISYKVRAIDVGSHISTSSNIVSIGDAVLHKGNESNKGNILSYLLEPAFPNPFNPSTQINFSVKEDGFVTLKVYDAIGNEIQTLVNESKQKGNYSINFDASNLASGVYIYRITAINSGRILFKESKRMILMK